MEPLVEVATFVLAKLREDMHEGLAGQGAATLNWRPYPDGNTIAGLVAHMFESGNFLLRTGLGETVTRERDRQFASSVPDAAALLAHIDAGAANLTGLAGQYTAARIAARHDFRGDDLPGAWFLLHCCEHLQEHWGQIQTIRDMAGAGFRTED